MHFLFLIFLSLSAFSANTRIPISMVTGAPQIAGTSYFAGTASCTWTRTSTTIGALTATAACPGPTIEYSQIGAWSTTDSDLPRQTITSLPAGTYKATFIFNAAQSTNIVSIGISINDGTTTCEAMPGINTNIASLHVVSCIFNYASSGTRVFELYTGSSSGTVTVANSQASAPRVSTRFILEYWGAY